jgi:hypothetical protein
MTSKAMEKAEPTVEMSLALLSDAVGKAAEDLRAVQASLDVARGDIAARNTSVSRRVIKDAERAIGHLKETDDCLRDVLQGLAQRD